MSKHLLLADDSITIQKVVELTFSDTGYRVTCVSGGGQALAKVREDRPDIILCDVIMPEKNGYEVTEALKSAPATRGIPIILLSGTFEPFDEDRARKAGADAWITKPFESQQLVAMVEEHLQKRIMMGGDAPAGGAQVTGSSPSSQGTGGRAPNPSETVNMAPPADLYSAYKTPAAASAFSTLPPPVSADPYAVPSFHPLSPAAQSVSAATTAAMPAAGADEPPAAPRFAVPGIEERRQAVTQDMTQRSAEPEEAVPALADAGGPSIRSTAPWAPLPPTAEPAPAAVTPEPEPDADFGAGTMQMMVGTGVKPWEQQPPAEAFAPPEIRPEQLLEETRRRGEAAAPATIESLAPLPRGGTVPGYVPQAERPVSPTDSTETLPALGAPMEAVPSWMAPAQPASPAEEVPSWMNPATPDHLPALVADAAPAWMSAADPVAATEAPPVAAVPSWMSAAEPLVATEAPPIAAVPSWMAPAEPGSSPLPVQSSPSWMNPVEAAPVSLPPAAPSGWMMPTPITDAVPAEPAEPLLPAVPASPPFLAPELPEAAVEPPPPPPPPMAASAPMPAWLAAPPPPEPVAAPAPSWLTPGGAPELPASAELEAPPAAAFAAPQVRPNQLFEETKRRHAPPAVAVPDPQPESGTGAFSSAATMAVMSAALGGELSSAAEARSQPAPAAEPRAPLMSFAAPIVNPEPELSPAAGPVQLSEAQIEAIARKMVEIFGDKILREVAWEVIPDMAEMLIKNRILELEGEAARENEKPAS